MSQCVVIATGLSDRWAPAPGGGKYIPPGKVCTVLQPSREVAEQEALRLAKQHPGTVFAVFEAVTIAQHQRVPTHVSISGHVLIDEPGSALTTLTNDEVPF